MAKELNMEYSELTQVMKTMLFCDAVKASGYGASTKYSLDSKTVYFAIKHGIINTWRV